MGGLFDRPQTPPPGVVPGFEFLPGLLQSLATSTEGQFGNLFNVPTTPLDPFLLAQLGAIPGLNETLGLAAPSGTSFAEGLQTGFAPDILSSVESRLLPALERSFQRGEAAIRESAGARGTLSSTGTTTDVGQLRGDLEGGLLQSLAGIESGLATNAQNIRAGLSSQGIGLPSATIQTLLGPISAALQSGQFSSSLPLQAVNAVSQGAASTPLFQPTFGSSKGEDILGLGTQLGSAFVGNPAAFSGKGGGGSAGK